MEDVQYCYKYISHNDILTTVKIVENLFELLYVKNYKPTDLTILNLSETVKCYCMSDHLIEYTHKDNIIDITNEMFRNIAKQIENDLFH